MAPTNGAGNQQQHAGGKKANYKSNATTKRKESDVTAQRRNGCPVLLESGCRIGDPVDARNPEDAVKMICQNPKCEYSPFIHGRCYEEWEDLLVTVMATTSWSRSWTDAQRRSNLWDKKGYQLIGKMCRCLCGKGHVRRDLDYKSPSKEEATKRKQKKSQANKSLPASKDSAVKTSCSTKPAPNSSSSNSVLGTTETRNSPTSSAITSCFINRDPIRCQDAISLQYSNSQDNDLQQSSRPNSICGTTNRTSSKGRTPGSQFRESTTKIDWSTDDAVDEIVPESSCNELERNVIPGVRSLLHWRDAPVQLNDPSLSEIINGCSAETRRKIHDAGGLGATLAKTGYFVVGTDSIRLVEAGIPLDTSQSNQGYAPLNESLPRKRKSQAACSSTAAFGGSVSPEIIHSLGSRGSTSPGNESVRDGQRHSVVADHQRLPPPFALSPFHCGPFVDEVVSSRNAAYTPSSGFDEESLESAVSDQEMVSNVGETNASPYQHCPPHEPRQDFVRFGLWPVDRPVGYVARPLQLFGCPTQFMTPVPAYVCPFVRPVSPIGPLKPLNWYVREYQLFSGPNLEDVFRRAIPSIYYGTSRRFEPTYV